MATQDELIQAELDGTIEELEAKADEQEADETPAQTADQTAEEVKEQPKEESTEATSDTPKEIQKDTTTEKQSSVMKLLAQRNAANAKVQELEAKIKSTEDLESRIKELEEGIAAQELEKEAQKEREAFYAQYPNAK